MTAPTIDEPPELPVFPASRTQPDQPATFFPKMLAFLAWFTLFREYLVQLIAYLESLGGGTGTGSGFVPFDIAETEYTITIDDLNRHLRFIADDDVTVVIPPDVGFPNGGGTRFTAAGNGTVTLVEAEGVTVNWLNGLVSEGRYAVFEIEYVGTDAWDAFGDLAEANPWDDVDIIFDADFKNGAYELNHVASTLAAMFENGATSWDTYSLPTVTAGQGIIAEATEASGGFDGETIDFAPKVSLAGTIGDVFVVAAVFTAPILTSSGGGSDFSTAGIDIFASEDFVAGGETLGPSSGAFSDSGTTLPPDTYIYAATAGSSATSVASETSTRMQVVGYIECSGDLGRTSINGSPMEEFQNVYAFTFEELRCALGAAATNGHAKAVLERLVIGHVSTYIDVSLLSDAEIPGVEASDTYTDELAQDAVGGILTDSGTIDFTYDDATPSITASVKSGSIGPTELAATAVTPGSYTSTNLTVDADGRITAASNGSAGGVSDGDKGDITVSGTGTVFTIDNDVVTFAKMQNSSAASKLVGRGSASGAGDFQEITLGTNLSMSGTTLNATGGGTLGDGDYGDITVSSSGTALTIDNDVVTYAKLQNVSATSRILGRKTASAGDTEECTLSEILDFIGSAAQGDILYRGAASWARLAAGTSGQYLKTQGTGANPVWDTPAGGSGDFEFITRQTVTTLSAVDIALPDAYDSFHIEFYFTPSTDNIGITAQITDDNFATVESGATDYHYSVFRYTASTAVTNSAGTTSISIMIVGQGNAAGEYNAGQLEIINAKESSPTTITGDYNYVTTAGAHGSNKLMAAYRQTTSINGIRITPTSGTLTGFYKVWGRKV